MAKHRLAVAIKKEEEKKHGNNWRSCIRRKAGSTKASAIFLDHLDPPGQLKKVAFKADKMARKLFDPPAQEPATWYGRLWCKVKSKIVHGFVPFLKTTSFIFDYSKDFFFFFYVFYKRVYIHSDFIKGLIIFNGATILTSGVIMGLSVQFDSAIVNLDTLAYPNLVWPLRVGIFIATPLVPVVVILRALSLTTKKRKLESEWTKEQATISKLFLKYNKLDREKAKVTKALSDMKMIEVSTEGVPQLYILLVLLIFSIRSDNCFTLIDNSDPWAIPFLVLSVLQTYATIIMSTISSINIKKGGQLSLSSKITLALSISFQLAAKLSIMLWIAIAASVSPLPDSPTAITTTSAVLLLVLPILIGWALNLLLHTCLNTDFHVLSLKDKMIHLLSNTWFTFPVRRMGERDQRHKGREMFFGLLLAGINLMGTFVAVIVSSQEEPLTIALSNCIVSPMKTPDVSIVAPLTTMSPLMKSEWM